mmetsp:Transcript_101278/g.285531  ORF Transcript_101278/g.285531 Transcript_101278/m.285531 type:complete len:520 (+) Transcript_101278:109-1668(+)
MAILVGATALAAAMALTVPPAALREPRRHRRQSVTASLTTDPTLAGPSTAAKEIEYNWRDQWYAVGFLEDMPASTADAPYAYSVFDEPLVLWHDGEALQCVADRCPHRLAALSEGAVEPDGSLRCFYHGWAFAGSGKCTALPQLPSGARIPRAACVAPHELRVREGIVWVWMGGGGAAPPFEPPCSPDDLDANVADFQVYDFTYELPYDHSYLVENLADPAHIPISHDRTPGGGKRENAEAYVMEVDGDSISARGWRGRLRPESKPDEPEAWQELLFDAPGIVRYRSRPRSKIFGAALHCMPRGEGRSRLLFRTYFSKNLLPAPARLLLGLKPRWARHLNSCKILEQDVALITSQEDHLARTGKTFAEEGLVTLRSSDAFVLAYRQWLDAVGHGMPWAVGWRTATPLARPRAEVPHVSLPGHRAGLSRLERHVRLSKCSQKALRRASATRKVAHVLLVCLVAAAYPLAGVPLTQKTRCLAAVATLGAGAVAAGAAAVQRAFKENFVRHPVRSLSDSLYP